MSKNTCSDYVDPSKEYQKICGGYRKKSNQSSKKNVGMQRNQKKVGGTMQYPFEPEFHNYPIPNKVDFKIENSTNTVNPTDLFGCKLVDTNYYSSASIKGGDCGCATGSIKLGGSLPGSRVQKKQQGAGFGYEMNCKQPITNRCEVDRYPTDSVLAGGFMNSSSNNQNKYLLEISKKKHQKGGSGASDSLMEYFLNFQHRCRGSEIY